MPVFVLGGAGLVMFGMVAATGIRILAGVDFTTNRNNCMIVAVAHRRRHDDAGCADIFDKMPHELKPLLDSASC